jgi:AcrR family transcriptional regulator
VPGAIAVATPRSASWRTPGTSEYSLRASWHALDRLLAYDEFRRPAPDPGMSPEQPRESIVQAAVPLIAEWDTVTTAQIARAAGIDEAALLRVFDDKDAILQACIVAVQAHVTTALDPTQVLQELQSISLDQPLAARLVEAIDALDTYYVRVRTRLEALATSGIAHRRPATDTGTPDEPHTRSLSHDDFRAAARLPATRQAITKLLEPDQEQLRLPAEILADAFLGISLGHARTPHPQRSPLPIEQLVDLFLHGALTTTDPA